MRAQRGQQVLFEKLLINPDGSKMEPGKQVQVRVKDPTGTVMYSGMAQFNLDLQSYSFVFIVPSDATLTTIDKTWTVDWGFISSDGSVVNVVGEFDVLEESTELPEQTILLNEKSDQENISFFLPERAQTFYLEGFDGGNNKVFETSDINNFVITPVMEGFIYDLRVSTMNLAVDDYLFRLTAKLPSKRSPHMEIVLVRVVPNHFWRLYPALKMLLDRARKRPDMVNAYTDSDLYEALCRGVAMVNASPPQMTNYTLASFPIGGAFWGGNDLSHFLLCGAALWLLQAQAVLYAETSFNFSGQTVTLDYDPTSAISGLIETYLNEINTKLPRAKNILIKSTTRVAMVGIRQQFYNHQLSRLDIFRRGLGYQAIVNAPMIGARFMF